MEQESNNVSGDEALDMVIDNGIKHTAIGDLYGDLAIERLAELRADALAYHHLISRLDALRGG